MRPQGRQQQDSHELLRFLIDGLQTEEEKRLKYQREARPEAGGAATPCGCLPRLFIWAAPLPLSFEAPRLP